MRRVMGILGATLWLVVLLPTSVLAANVFVDPNYATISAVGLTNTVDVSVDNPDGIQAATFNVTYNSGVVLATDAVKGTVLTDCLTNSNTASPGTVLLTFSCTDPLAAGSAAPFFTITFQGQSVGTSGINLGTCDLDEGGTPCTPSNGSIQVLGVTNTPTETPTITATSTPTNTPTITPTPLPTDTPTEGPSPTPTNTPTNTPTPLPTNTPTATPTNTPTGTNTNTPTTTPTATATSTGTGTRTPTNTPTETPIPAPRIISGATKGSMQVSGTSAANVNVQILSTGPDGEVGGGDDELLGSGSSSAGGIFVVSLSRALVNGESIYPMDTDNGLTGNPVAVRDPAPIPATTPVGAALLTLLLGGGLLWRARRRS